MTSSINLSDLNGSNGFTVEGIASNIFLSSISVSSAGDVNGDGFDDIIIGASNGSSNGIRSGESHVLFGSNSGFPARLDVSALNGSNGFTLNGVAADDFSGRSVSNAGDVNGDGFDDVIIGASLARGFAGESYVVFGSNTGFPARLELSTLDGSNGFTLRGTDSNDFSGSSVSSAGDVNGDGFDDIIIGASRAEPNGDNSGESYVVFGNNTGFPSSLDLSASGGDKPPKKHTHRRL